jgi:hypothetical protein
MRARWILSGVVLVLVAACCRTETKPVVVPDDRQVVQPAAAAPPAPLYQDGTPVVIEGRLRQVGAGRWVSLVVTTASNVDVYLELTREQRPAMEEFVYRRVRADGIIQTVAMRAPGGIFRHWQYRLTPRELVPLGGVDPAFDKAKPE